MISAPVRTDPPLAGDETSTLLAFLDYQRDTLLSKAAGLSAQQLCTRLAPSTMTLAGMVKHLACVEHWWLHHVFGGHDFAEPWASVDWEADRDWEWHSAERETPEELAQHLARARAVSDAAIAAATSLDQVSARTGRTGEPYSLRWILLHLVEEYARHNGHADLIRESIDGSTGD